MEVLEEEELEALVIRVVLMVVLEEELAEESLPGIQYLEGVQMPQDT